MSMSKMVAVGLVFIVACGGWYVLGTSTKVRSQETRTALGADVERMWGVTLVQAAPSFSVQVPGAKQVRPVMPVENIIKVDINADHRKKGLNWYPTYTCGFDGTYPITNTDAVAQKVRIRFDFPAKHGTYDEFNISLDGEPLTSSVDTMAGMAEIVELAPGGETLFRVKYRTRGIGEWRYRMDPSVGRVQGLNLTVNTDFRNVDYPQGSLSPMMPEETGDGMLLTWKASDLITTQDIGVVIPGRLNPGPLTSRITFFAPVCLLFFFVLVGTINILYGVNIHPMHYLFVAAGFFAFHLLLAYMAGLVHIHVAFAVSAITSVVLVTGYLSAALRGEFPWKVAIAGQLFFLVLFSYSFFLEGITGLTVAIGSVVTLGILMKVTAHVDWDEVFESKVKKPAPPKPATPVPPVLTNSPSTEG